MYKTIPNATEYEISIKDETIRRKDGDICELPFTVINESKCVTLKIYGIVRTVSTEWLKLLANFEVDVERCYFFNIDFVPMKDWKYANSVKKVMVFRNSHPEYKPGFRLIPNYTRYAVSEEGVVHDTYLNILVKPLNTKGLYTRVNIYDPDKNKVVHVLLHRFVALAWKPNKSHTVFYLVNHLDGDKCNPHASNLEWTNHLGNIDPAFKTGLRSENLPCKVRNVDTGEITEFNTIVEACTFIGISHVPYTEILTRSKHRPLNGLYELRVSSDTTPWNLSLQKLTDPNCRSVITLTDKEGAITVYRGYREVCKSVDIQFRRTCREMNNQLKRLGYTVEVKKLTPHTKDDKPIQVRTVETGIVQTFDNIREASKMLNIHVTVIRNYLGRDETSVSKGLQYRYKCDKPWKEGVNEATNIPKRILGVCTDGREIEFTSLLDVLRQTGVNSKAVVRAINTGIQVSSTWKFYKN
jgi:hypothetical protein